MRVVKACAVRFISMHGLKKIGYCFMYLFILARSQCRCICEECAMHRRWSFSLKCTVAGGVSSWRASWPHRRWKREEGRSVISFYSFFPITPHSPSCFLYIDALFFWRYIVSICSAISACTFSHDEKSYSPPTRTKMLFPVFLELFIFFVGLLFSAWSKSQKFQWQLS